MNLHCTVKAPQNVIYTEMDNEIVLMHVSNGKYYSLNSVGSLVWKLLASPIKIEAICDVVEQDFEVDKEVCQQDVIFLIEELYQIGLVEVDE